VPPVLECEQPGLAFPQGELLLSPTTSHSPNHDQTRMDAQTESELDTFFLLQTAIEFSHHIENAKARPYRSLCIIFMRLGIAKID